MDKHTWDETVGGNSTLIDDLEWELFTTRRAFKELQDHHPTNIDDPARKIRNTRVAQARYFMRKIKDTRIALAALYQSDRGTNHDEIS